MGELGSSESSWVSVLLGEVLAQDPGRAAGAVWMAADGSTESARNACDDSTMFELGSLTKTMTATLLAEMVRQGEVTLEATVGDVLGPEKAGGCMDVTLLQLATHTAGLPRLAPGAARPPFWPRDPYRFFGRARLERALARARPANVGTIAYSNFGYDLLGHVLAEAAGTPFGRLLEDRVLAPAGMTTARCQPCDDAGLAKGKGHLVLGGGRWHQRLGGAGGVDGALPDLTAWLRANLLPESTPLAAAVRACHEVRVAEGDARLGLAWAVGRTTWHTGGTGCFQSFIAFEPGKGGLALALASGTAGYDDHVRAFLADRLGPLTPTD